MGKDLRTTAVQMKLHRVKKVNMDAWGLRDAQSFFPPLEMLFKTDALSSVESYGIHVSEGIESVLDASRIRTTTGRTVPVHRKTTMILSPFKTMRGDYGHPSLPKPSEVAEEIRTRTQSPHTAAYVGALASVALSESGCDHFPKVFGVSVGIAETHTIDVSDDYADLTERGWFADAIGKTFDLKLRSTEGDAEFTHTRRQRPMLELGDEIELGDVSDVEADHVSTPSASSSVGDVTETMHPEEESCSDSSGSCDVYEIESCDCPDDDEDDEDVEEEDEEPFAWATFRGVPVVSTAMEVCEGTFYDLIEKDLDPEKHVAWVSQMVFALAYAQRNYGFTHNDLHGNNVMFVKTDKECLYYRHNGVSYRVPTFGYLIKIIDFDRAIVSVRLNGMKEGRLFASSQFEEEEEAGGQYNMDPFMNHEHPYIGPNSSFDLCRFATSVFWDMFPAGPDVPCDHPLLDIFKQWMTFGDGTSAMFRKKRDNHDRYHGFDLYKAIARYCKDSAVPRRELLKLKQYVVPTVPVGESALFIES